MGLVLRGEKNEELLHEELDQNFTYLDNKLKILPRAPGIDDDASKGYIVNETLWFDSSTSVHWIIVNATVGAAIWIRHESSRETISTFLDLEDTPDEYEEDSVVCVNPEGDKLKFMEIIEGTFLVFPDTPNSYVGMALKALRVREDELALEFGDVQGVGSGLSHYISSNTPNSEEGANGDLWFLVVPESTTAKFEAGAVLSDESSPADTLGKEGDIFFLLEAEVQ